MAGSNSKLTWIGTASRCVAVTPSDSTDLAFVAASLYIGATRKY